MARIVALLAILAALLVGCDDNGVALSKGGSVTVSCVG
jgi:hypothetical protein